jgi:predicted MFS family arabinose efflux permease
VPTVLYRQLFQTDYVRSLLISNFVGRIPDGSGTIAILMFLIDADFGYRRAGLAIAVYGLAIALGGPFLGRIVDRTKQPPTLIVSALLSSSAYIALAFTQPLRDEHFVYALVLLAGLFTPPLEPCLRTIWPTVLKDDNLVHSAFAFDSSLQELIFITGPLLAALCASTVNPAFGLVFVTSLSLVGAFAYCFLPPVRRWRAHAPGHCGERPRWWGPLGRVSVDATLISFLFIGSTIGVLNLVAVAFAESHQSSPQSGVILSANAFGSLIGGLFYGRRPPSSRAIDQLPTLTTCLLISYAPTAVVGLLSVGALPLMSLSVFIAGLPLAPTIAAAFSALASQTLPGTETEVFAWLVSMILLGNAAGAAIAGELIANSGWGTGGAVTIVPLLFAWAASKFAQTKQVPHHTKPDERLTVTP